MPYIENILTSYSACLVVLFIPISSLSACVIGSLCLEVRGNGGSSGLLLERRLSLDWMASDSRRARYSTAKSEQIEGL